MTEPIEESGPPIEPPAPPLIAYRAALKRYDGVRLVEIHAALGGADLGGKPNRLPDAIADRLAEHRVAERIVAALPHGSRVALGLIALAEANAWPASGLALGLACLGVDPAPAILGLLQSGLVAARPVDPFEVVVEYERSVGSGIRSTTFLAHPSASNAARTVLPEGEGPPTTGAVRQVRESDGLEPILRLAAAWQRIAEGPIRQTQQGTFFKRDRERLEDDPVLAGPITDALEPLPDMTLLWIDLARAVGLVVPEPNSDRLVAAPPDFWAENAVHLPQMIATRWLSLRDWHEQAGMRAEGSPTDLALPYVRASALLWLARSEEGEWVAIEDLAALLTSLAPGWDRTLLADPPAPRAPEAGVETLGSVLLGPAYQLGLVRAAEETPGGRRAVQLTPLGRYGLALGPPPPPRATFDHFLMVQPNFELIAYRQGLTPSLIGQFSRFARWTQVGAALELKLTPDSVYRGLEGGMTTESTLDRMARHSARPLPAGVAEALRTWAGRRDRVTYYGSATLVEFATPDELEAALGLWPSTARMAPVRISDRLLLVEEEGSIPFTRFRMAGARDYRKPGEACVDVEPDGVTLSLDLGRSDLLVDAELARFADERPSQSRADGASTPRRSFVVTPNSLARAAENGLTPAQLSRWFQQRTGGEVPASIRLLYHAAGPRVEPFTTSRPIVLTVSAPDLLDGLLQHPSTGLLLGDRLGPSTVVVPEDALDDLRNALSVLGLSLADEASRTTPTEGPSRSPRPPTKVRRT